MSIKQTKELIAELSDDVLVIWDDNDKEYGNCEGKDLKALADSHTKLEEAVRKVRMVLAGHYDLLGAIRIIQDVINEAALKEAE